MDTDVDERRRTGLDRADTGEGGTSHKSSSSRREVGWTLIEALVLGMGTVLLLSLLGAASSGWLRARRAASLHAESRAAFMRAREQLEQDREVSWPPPSLAVVARLESSADSITLGPYQVGDDLVRHRWERRGVRWRWSRVVEHADGRETRQTLLAGFVVSGEVPVAGASQLEPLHFAVDCGVAWRWTASQEAGGRAGGVAGESRRVVWFDASGMFVSVGRGVHEWGPLWTLDRPAAGWADQPWVESELVATWLVFDLNGFRSRVAVAP